MPQYDFDKMTKTIIEEDSRTALCDAIADLLLIHNGDRSEIDCLIEEAWPSAESHYQAECDGDSEGFRVIVVPIDGDIRALDGKKLDGSDQPDEE